MLASILLAALTPLLATAAPTPETDFFSSLAKRQDATSIAYCNTAAITMNPAGLPPPSANLVLDHIAVGRGTQNYTCENSTSSAIPKAIGAVATLFNVTCLAGPYPSLLDTMPSIALKFPAPDSASPMNPANLFLSGHHYFTDLTTPTFNLNTASHEWGIVGCSKLNATNAQNSAKDVTNLKLASKSRDGCTIAEVYRLNGAGGQPPATCDGAKAAFQVQYAAEYWFWSNPGLASYT